MSGAQPSPIAGVGNVHKPGMVGGTAPKKPTRKPAKGGGGKGKGGGRR